MRGLKVQKRFIYRIFAFVVLAALGAGAAVLPLRLGAQEPAAGQTMSAQAARPEAAQSDEEQQTKAFLFEGPVVIRTAKVLHLSVEMTAEIFLIINFAIIFFGIGIPLFRFLPKHLRARGEKVQSDIESARKVTEDANSRLSAVEAKL